MDFKACIATVTCEKFLLGTLVTLDSFLKHNAWFEGDLVIIQDDLTPKSVSLLKSCFSNIIFLNPDEAFTATLDELTDRLPELSMQRRQFYSVEAFSLTEYDKVLFCDSDLLFRGSVKNLFLTKEKLLCCGDGPYYRGNVRKTQGFGEIKQELNKAENQLYDTFNSGFMLLDSSILNRENYEGLLSLILTQNWEEDKTGHTDQLIFNHYFANQQSLISPIYNYTLLHRGDIYRATSKTLNDAVVIHYNGVAKPWWPDRFVELSAQDPAVISALEWWNSAYISFLTRKSLSGARLKE